MQKAPDSNVPNGVPSIIIISRQASLRWKKRFRYGVQEEQIPAESTLFNLVVLGSVARHMRLLSGLLGKGLPRNDAAIGLQVLDMHNT